MDKEIKVKADIKKRSMKLIPKIIWGIDSVGFVFIYFKMKDVSNNTYVKDVCSIMYQDPRKYEGNEVINRMNIIISYIKKVYSVTDIMRFNSRNHLFIKGKIFYEYDKMIKFYNNLISNIIVEIAENVNPKYINQIGRTEKIQSVNDGGMIFKDYDFSKTIGVLNFFK